MDHIDNQLVEIKAQIRVKGRLKGQLKKIKSQQLDLVNRKHRLEDALRKEEMDVEKLEGMSFTNFFHTLLGDKVEKLEREKREALAAKMKYDGVITELGDLSTEIEQIESRIRTFGNLEASYKQLMTEKERRLLNVPGAIGRKLNEITENQAQKAGKQKELKEAIDAGHDLIMALRNAHNSLSSASNWGTWDILGGGMISTMAKHSRIDEAKTEINHVQYLLRRFRRELQDVDEGVYLSGIDIGSFLTFADYFFDGLFADLAVQNKINNAKIQVEQNIDRVEAIYERLKKAYDRTLKDYEELNRERVSLIEQSKI